jgi:hypothetical protein
MKKFTDMLSAKFVAKVNDESGDVVQTLLVIAFSVVVGILFFTTLQEPIAACIDAVAGGSGTCFGQNIGG